MLGRNKLELARNKAVKQNIVKPFVKWAGGKRQILDVLVQHFPQKLKDNQIDTYIEPFVGGGCPIILSPTKLSIQTCLY